MSIIERARHKFRTSGVSGVVAATLRRAATCLDPQPQAGASQSQQSNPFLAWVQFAVPGMLCRGNIAAMEYAIAHMPIGAAVLEIGSFSGLSTIVLSYLLEKHFLTAPLYTCDKWEFEGQQLGAMLGDSRSVTHDAYREYVRNSFLRNMQTFSPHKLPYTIECFSDEFFRRWFAGEESVDVFGRRVSLGGDLGFCYIDGNHTYGFAKRDFANADRAIVPGGFILFDDSADGSEWEVNRLAREIAASTEYEVVDKSPNYLFRKKYSPTSRATADG